MRTHSSNSKEFIFHIAMTCYDSLWMEGGWVDEHRFTANNSSITALLDALKCLRSVGAARSFTARNHATQRSGTCWKLVNTERRNKGAVADLLAAHLNIKNPL